MLGARRSGNHMGLAFLIAPERVTAARSAVSDGLLASSARGCGLVMRGGVPGDAAGRSPHRWSRARRQQAERCQEAERRSTARVGAAGHMTL